MRTAILCLLLTIYCSKAFAQSPLNSVAFASPNAAQMGSFGQVKVDHFNGLPNISIPLYTAQMGALSLPLTLSYHGGG